MTVPFTARSPIEPPGKRIGLTTKLSVVSARPTPSISTVPASPIASSEAEAKAGANSPSIRVCVALPPAPWDIVTCESLNLGRFERVVSMIERIRCSRSETAASATQTTALSLAKRP